MSRFYNKEEAIKSLIEETKVIVGELHANYHKEKNLQLKRKIQKELNKAYEHYHKKVKDIKTGRIFYE